MEITPIGHIHTAFSEKFGIPRQSLMAEDMSVITFEPEYRSKEFFRGLDGFSHIWILWIFSKNVNTKKHSTVRPPVLGGNKRIGVFAARSPFRPNNIGLSLVKVHHIEENTAEGTKIYVTGTDMLDDTPVIDIKPYIPYIESVPGASGGFAEEKGRNTVRLDVDTSENAFQSMVRYFSESFYTDEEIKNEIEIVKELISLDPRPRYQNDPERVYGMKYRDLDIRFMILGKKAKILEVRRI